MKVKEVIKELSELNPEEELIIGWWTHGFINESWSGQITDQEWSDIVASSNSMDWTTIDKAIDNIVDFNHYPKE